MSSLPIRDPMPGMPGTPRDRRGTFPAPIGAHRSRSRRERLPRDVETVPPAQRHVVAAALAVTVAAVLALKVLTLQGIQREIFWGSYAILVGVYLLSRFALGARYHPSPARTLEARLPSVSIVVPAMNEQDAIGRTLRHALESDYPAHLIEVIAVDDGSSDQTRQVMELMQRRHPGMMRIVSMENRGKRFAMAEGFVRARGDIVVFIDSDSFVDPEGVRRLVDYFADRRVGAVAGHTDVQNSSKNMLTRMQSVRYYVAFKVVKASEALFGSVTCCSGCFSGYRREAIEPVLDEWLDQTFADTRSTYGDDRSLTNFILQQRWRIIYAPDARATTIVPQKIGQFMRQQLRWKKSWIRESLRASRFMWKRPFVMALGFYTGVFLTLMAPIVFLRYMVIRPALGNGPPWVYAGGLLLMALFFGLYHRLRRRSSDWIFGILYALFYSTVLVWQTPYALATLRDTKWGTR